MNRIQKLVKRRNECVCKMCGNKLEIRRVVHNQYGGEGTELYCPTCQKIEYGIEPISYALAKEFSDTFEFNYFVDMEENEQNYRLNVGKVAEIISWALKNKERIEDEL